MPLRIYRLFLLFSFTFLGMGTLLLAQLPNTELYLFEFSILGTKMQVKDVEFLSSFNKGGYTNQPRFIDEDRLMVTVGDETGMTDLYLLNIYKQTYQRCTATKSISEFSAKPSAIAGYMNTVRIEADGQTQSLWAYPESWSHGGYRLLPDLGDIGYYEWISDEEVVLFRVSDPPTMVIANVNSGKQEEIVSGVGRTFRMNRAGELLFVHKLSDEFWYLKALDLEERRARIVAEIESEDFEVLSNGAYLYGKGSELFYLDEDSGQDWQKVADLKEYGVNNISRISSIRNQIVFVDEK